MVDRYTKIVLAVIALALVALAVRPVLESRPARAQEPATPQRPACGTYDNPCYVTGTVSLAEGVLVAGTVAVTNWPPIQLVQVRGVDQAIPVIRGGNQPIPVCLTPASFQC
ncbi:MAG: hypothetical protein HY726_14115 [Candidatus Rokubacteria bacterium]|nr:hypothetical protein [Candidatus Rokubacteria bacterium]